MKLPREQRRQHTELIVLQVLEKDAFGRPKVCRVLYDETTATLQGGEEFITAAVMPRVVQPVVKGSA